MDYSPTGFSVNGIFSRQEYWSRLSLPPPGDLPDPGTEPPSPALAESSLLSHLGSPNKNYEVGTLVIHFMGEASETKRLNSLPKDSNAGRLASRKVA